MEIDSWSYRWLNRSMSTWMPWNGLLGLDLSWPHSAVVIVIVLIVDIDHHSSRFCRETVSDYSWHILSYPDFLQALGIRSLCGWLLLSTTGCTNSCESDPFGALRGPALWELWLTKLGWLTRYKAGYDNRIHVPCKWKIYTSILMMISFTTFISSWHFGAHRTGPQYPFSSLKFPVWANVTQHSLWKVI